MAGSARGAVVFDLDGTLVHSAPDIHLALNLVLEAEGAAPLTLAEVVGFIGHGIPQLVRQAQEYRGLDRARLASMTEAMFAQYLARPHALTRPYPGVVAALEGLQAAGHPLGLCTNKAMAPTLAILEALDLRRFFGVVIGGDSLAVKKPDPAPLRAAFDALGGGVGEGFGLGGVYVGDSEVDAETAVAANVPFALFTGGYRKSPLSALPHDLAFDAFDALPGLIGRI